jgi:hypothetical protein
VPPVFVIEAMLWRGVSNEGTFAIGERRERRRGALNDRNKPEVFRSSADLAPHSGLRSETAAESVYRAQARNDALALIMGRSMARDLLTYVDDEHLEEDE